MSATLAGAATEHRRVAPAQRAVRAVPRAVWVILVIALALRIGAIVATPHFAPVSDPADYVRHATSIAAGHGYPPSIAAPGGGASALRPPLYPYFLGGVYVATGNSQTAGRLAAALAGVLTVALIGLLAFQLWRRRRVAYTAMALAAVYPPFVLVSATLLSESLALPLMLGALAAVLAYRNRGAGYGLAVLAGALLGLGILDRPALAVLLLPVALGCWLPPRRRWTAVGPPAAAIATAALCLVPWTIRNAVELKTFVPVSTQDSYLLAGTYNDVARHDPRFPATYRPANAVPEFARLFQTNRLNEAQFAARLRSAAVKYIRVHPGYVADVAYRNTLRLLQLDGGLSYVKLVYGFQGVPARAALPAWLAFYAVALLALAGLALGAVRRRAGWLWLSPLLLWISVVVISGDLRYRLPVELFIVLLAGFALARGWDRLSPQGDAPVPQA
jgi:4-amino-4-deoxy-L-arabinose transferase-like glycosyltransferase